MLSNINVQLDGNSVTPPAHKELLFFLGVGDLLQQEMSVTRVRKSYAVKPEDGQAHWMVSTVPYDKSGAATRKFKKGARAGQVYVSVDALGGDYIEDPGVATVLLRAAVGSTFEYEMQFYVILDKYHALGDDGSAYLLITADGN